MLMLLYTDKIYLFAAAISDDCVPLPITPVVVGHDHEWLSVSPLSLPAWVSQVATVYLLILNLAMITTIYYMQDKLLFEPYALRKNVAYLVLVPSPGLSTSPSNIYNALKNYFRDLSITFKVSLLLQ